MKSIDDHTNSPLDRPEIHNAKSERFSISLSYFQDIEAKSKFGGKSPERVPIKVANSSNEPFVTPVRDKHGYLALSVDSPEQSLKLNSSRQATPPSKDAALLLSLRTKSLSNDDAPRDTKGLLIFNSANSSPHILLQSSNSSSRPSSKDADLLHSLRSRSLSNGTDQQLSPSNTASLSSNGSANVNTALPTIMERSDNSISIPDECSTSVENVTDVILSRYDTGVREILRRSVDSSSGDVKGFTMNDCGIRPEEVANIATNPSQPFIEKSTAVSKSALSTGKPLSGGNNDSRGTVSRGVSFVNTFSDIDSETSSIDSRTKSGKSNNIVLTTLRDSMLKKQQQQSPRHLKDKVNLQSKSTGSSGGDRRSMHSKQSSFSSVDWFGFKNHFSVSDDTNEVDNLSAIEAGTGMNSYGESESYDLGENNSSQHKTKSLATPSSPRKSLNNRRTSIFGINVTNSTSMVDMTLHSLERATQVNYSSDSTHSDSKKGPSKLFSVEYDYAIVFPYPHQVQSPDCKYMIHSLIQAGLEVYPYPSVKGDELFVLIRAPLDVLKTIAEKSDFKMLLDPRVLKETLLRGNPEKRIAPLRIRHDPTITTVTPFEHIYLKFQAENSMDLYYRKPGDEHPFSRSARLKLIHFLINAPKRFGGCDMHLSNMIHRKAVRCMFPLHDVRKCNELLRQCTSAYAMPWQYPSLDLQEYLGEKIALYNVFIGHYSYWLCIPAVIGVGCQAVVLVTGDFSHPVLMFYGMLMTIWAIFMLEFWKREEHRTAMRWGMIDYVSREADRPEFHGQPYTYSHIDGKEMLYFPPIEKRRRIILSLGVIFAFILLVIGVIACIYVVRYSLQPHIHIYSSLVSSCLNVLQITSFNLLYQAIAVRLNNQENHRTDTAYEDALIAKVFMFQFINSYASYFFLAFVAGNLKTNHGAKTDLGECGFSNCMRPLSLNLFLIFFARITAKNVLDIAVPYIKCIIKIRSEARGIHSHSLTPAEMDHMLMTYDSTLESIRIYADSAVQYGFMLLFVTALPCATLASLVNNYVKMKFNAWKILTLYQRPIPTGTENIKSWQTIFSIVSVVAVGTNAGLVCFTMDILKGYTLSKRVWIFIGFQWFIFSVQYVSTLLIDSEPEEVRIQKLRMQCIQEKVIDKYEDDDFGVEIQYDSDEDEDDDDGEGEDDIGFKENRVTPPPMPFTSMKSITMHTATDGGGMDRRAQYCEQPMENKRSLKRHNTVLDNNDKKSGFGSWLWRRKSSAAGGFGGHGQSTPFGKNIMSRHQSSTGNRQHKRIYGDSLPSVPVLEYPVTDRKEDWHRPIDREEAGGDAMDYDILRLNI